jgi:hypothetical protein
MDKGCLGLDEQESARRSHTEEEFLPELVDIFMDEFKLHCVDSDGNLSTTVGKTRVTLLAGVTFHLIANMPDEDVFTYFMDLDLLEGVVNLLAHADSTALERMYCAQVLYLLATCDAISDSVISAVKSNEGAVANIVGLQEGPSVDNAESLEARLVARHTISKLQLYSVHSPQILEAKKVLETGKAKEKENALRIISRLLDTDVPETREVEKEGEGKMTETVCGGLARYIDESLRASVEQLMEKGTKNAKALAVQVMQKLSPQDVRSSDDPFLCDLLKERGRRESDSDSDDDMMG